jgi:hypothetical protein
MPQNNNNVAIGIVVFDFELFLGVRFPNSLHPRKLNVLEIKERNSTIISRLEIVS